MTVPALLELEGLRTEIRGYGRVVRAVDGVSIAIAAGETLGLVGESGCGKTMTAMSVLRLLPPGGRILDGHVLFRGRDLTALPEPELRAVRGGEIGVVFQDPMGALNPTMRIGDQVGEPLLVHRGASRTEALEKAAELLAEVGVPDPRARLSEYPHQLSGGLRQRVVLAMALACEPRLLLADEPTTALDATIQAQILALLDERKAALSMAVLLVTHDLSIVAGRADRVAVMYAGRVVETAPTAELFRRPRHPYTKALLEAVPAPDQPPGEPLATIPGVPPDLSRPLSGCRFAPRCAFATSRCEREDPPLEHEDELHAFACFHPLAAPPRARIPRPEADAPGTGGGEERALGSPSQTPGQTQTTEQAPSLASRRVSARSSESGPGRARAPLLVAEHLVKRFAVTKGALVRRPVGWLEAVSDVSLVVHEGETFGLVGESGCGKTTLARLLVGLERPDSGTVRLGGVDFWRLPRRTLRHHRRQVQLVFQDPSASLDPRMRVGPALAEPLHIQRVGTRRERAERVRELLEDVGLGDEAARAFPHEFSGGQRQRIGLARALALRPRLVVADEPVSALDVSIRAQVLNLMRRLQREHGLTYVVISHDLSVVRFLSDRVGVMYLGKLVELGPSDAVYEAPAHPYTEALLSAVPVPDPDRRRRGARAALLGEPPSPLRPPSGCRFRTRCPRAQPVCAEREPALRRFGPGHLAACHFPLTTPEESEGPGGAELRPTGPANA